MTGTEEPDRGDNRAVVLSLIELTFRQARITEGVELCVAEEYTQHNPMVADGRRGVIDFFERLWQRFPQLQYDVQHVVASGDLVCVHAKCVRAPDLAADAIFDLFRLEDGWIVEHWDAIQSVPAQSANPHPMF